jgi:uncharacterized protein (TIGR02145 family)
MRKLIFLLFLFSSTIASAQEIENINFFLEGKNIVVTYDFVNCTTSDMYDISVVFVEQNQSRVIPISLSGDIKKVSCGSKRIVWNVLNDREELSGKYQVWLDFKVASKLANNNLIDIDNNTYKTVPIGTQQWMAENLKVTKYNDGTIIPNITDDTQWSNLRSGAWAYYKNDAANNAKYGILYNWYAVSKTSNGNKNVCPTGWHLPTDAEWTVLTDYLGGESVAGGKMKEVGTTNWNSSNTNATNTSLFTGLPGGYRISNGDYTTIGGGGNWWSSTENLTNDAWNRNLNTYNGDAYRSSSLKKYGLSVRCLRD